MALRLSGLRNYALLGFASLTTNLCTTDITHVGVRFAHHQPMHWSAGVPPASPPIPSFPRKRGKGLTSDI